MLGSVNVKFHIGSKYAKMVLNKKILKRGVSGFFKLTNYKLTYEVFFSRVYSKNAAAAWFVYFKVLFNKF